MEDSLHYTTSNDTPSSATLTLGDIARLLSRSKMFIAAMTIAGGVLTAAYSLIMPQTFESTATILPPESDKAGGLSSLLQSATGSAGLDLGGLGGSSAKSMLYVDILKSRSVAETVIEQCSLRAYHTFALLNRDKSLREARSMMDIATNSTGLIFVSAAAKTPWLSGEAEQEKARQLAADIANTAVAALDSLNKTKNTTAARKAKEYLDRALAEHKERLDAAHAALEEFGKEHKVLLLEEQTAAVVKNAIEVGAELARTDIELEIARAEMSSGTPLVLTLEQKKENLLRQYRQIQAGGLVEDDAFSIPLSNVPTLARRYAELVREAKTLEKISVFLETQRAQEALQEQRDTPTVQVLDAAVPPEDRLSPRRGLMVLVGSLLATLLAAFIVLWRSFRLGHQFTKAPLA